jgi:hypothetical protein
LIAFVTTRVRLWGGKQWQRLANKGPCLLARLLIEWWQTRHIMLLLSLLFYWLPPEWVLVLNPRPPCPIPFRSKSATRCSLGVEKLLLLFEEAASAVTTYLDAVPCSSVCWHCLPGAIWGVGVRGDQ